MGMPRTQAGFEKAIADIEEQITALEEVLDDVEVGSEEETKAIEDKANLTVDLEVIKSKFKEFLEKQPSEEADQSEDEQIEPEKPEITMAKAPTQTKPEERKWPETVFVRASASAGWMVDPYTHIKYTEDFKRVPVTPWLKAQIKAGLLVEDASEE